MHLIADNWEKKHQGSSMKGLHILYTNYSFKCKLKKIKSKINDSEKMISTAKVKLFWIHLNYKWSWWLLIILREFIPYWFLFSQMILSTCYIFLWNFGTKPNIFLFEVIFNTQMSLHILCKVNNLHIVTFDVLCKKKVWHT